MNAQFKIEKGIPLPKAGRQTKWPFVDMAVGDSVFIEGQGSDGNAYAAARKLKKRYGREFIAKAINGGVRIWRIK